LKADYDQVVSDVSELTSSLFWKTNAAVVCFLLLTNATSTLAFVVSISYGLIKFTCLWNGTRIYCCFFLWYGVESYLADWLLLSYWNAWYILNDWTQYQLHCFKHIAMVKTEKQLERTHAQIQVCILLDGMCFLRFGVIWGNVHACCRKICQSLMSCDI
jgi:hypothetical protein